MLRLEDRGDWISGRHGEYVRRIEHAALPTSGILPSERLLAQLESAPGVDCLEGELQARIIVRRWDGEQSAEYRGRVRG